MGVRQVDVGITTFILTIINPKFYPDQRIVYKNESREVSFLEELCFNVGGKIHLALSTEFIM